MIVVVTDFLRMLHLVHVCVSSSL